MKRELIGLITGLLLFSGFAAFGGPFDTAKVLSVTDIDTGEYTQSTASATSPKLSGYLEGVYIDIAGGVTADVDIVTVTNAGRSSQGERTFWSQDSVTASGWYRILVPVQDTIGNNIVGGAITNYARPILVNDKIRVKAYDATATQTTDTAVSVYPVISDN